MSVAFRRDCDEEHLEPKFELPVPPGPNLVTARGLALIEERIAALESNLADAVDEAVTTAIKRDLRYWHRRSITAELPPPPSGDRAEFGTTVRILLKGKPRMFVIVGDDEADPPTGLISFKSPLARAMRGAEIGDILPFAGRDDAIEITGIEITGIEITGIAITRMTGVPETPPA